MTSPDPINIRQNVALAPLTTFDVGGPARLFVRVASEAQVVEAFKYASANAIDVFVLGGGSNILVSDRGFDGLVVQVALGGVRILEPPAAAGGLIEEIRDDSQGRRSTAGDSDLKAITAQAGEDWDAFVEFCVRRNFAGVECLSGIPGFVGGTPVQNVGAYGQEVSESILSVRCFDRADREIVTLSNSECGFTYRASIFNSTERDRYVVLSVTYGLTSNGAPKIAYKDLREYFSERRPTLSEMREAILEIRRSKSMVIDSDDPNRRSAGSFFKNPIVERTKFEEIVARSGSETVPHFSVDGGLIKIPAAWLIEQTGFGKGYRLGKAGISTNHSLALINLGGASATEIIALKQKIQDEVMQKFDILLRPEPVFVGID